MNILIIVGYLLALGLGWAAGFYGYKKTLTQKAIQFKEKMAKAKELEEEIIEEAKKKAEKVVEQAEEKAQKIEDQRLQKMEVIQNRLIAREEKMDEKLEKLEQEKAKLTDKQKLLDEKIHEQTNKLSEMAKLTKEEAKTQFMNKIEKEYQKWFYCLYRKTKEYQKRRSRQGSSYDY
jgi:ribonucrease Y